ncbi:MAG: hypothetical protein ACRDTX_05850 [Pseudonocardiaceae bacterium]
MRVVLDAEAVNALLDRTHPGERTVRRALTTAYRLSREVVVPTVILANHCRAATVAAVTEGQAVRARVA